MVRMGRLMVLEMGGGFEVSTVVPSELVVLPESVRILVVTPRMVRMDVPFSARSRSYSLSLHLLKIILPLRSISSRSLSDK
jgi:hypothetical protein